MPKYFSFFITTFQGIVINTGEKSEFGDIFKMMQAEEVRRKVMLVNLACFGLYKIVLHNFIIVFQT